MIAGPFPAFLPVRGAFDSGKQWLSKHLLRRLLTPGYGDFHGVFRRFYAEAFEYSLPKLRYVRLGSSVVTAVLFTVADSLVRLRGCGAPSYHLSGFRGKKWLLALTHVSLIAGQSSTWWVTSQAFFLNDFFSSGLTAHEVM
ncbi:hypothetical protein F2Q70_00009682 [Brassica cretica]|uniref:Uncharacterized protein n=1 Tax=Brassica cretica TaxID=69181 RepID=A0A8S9LT14_BRACR|nr:hypothetical protein F2Q70_00009682 [Brassica cretica]